MNSRHVAAHRGRQLLSSVSVVNLSSDVHLPRMFVVRTTYSEDGSHIRIKRRHTTDVDGSKHQRRGDGSVNHYATTGHDDQQMTSIDDDHQHSHSTLPTLKHSQLLPETSRHQRHTLYRGPVSTPTSVPDVDSMSDSLTLPRIEEVLKSEGVETTSITEQINKLKNKMNR